MSCAATSEWQGIETSLLVQTEADIPAGSDWLTEWEVRCFDAMRFPKRRADWRLGRWTAKSAVAGHLKAGLSPKILAEIEIRPAPSGAPEVFLANKPAPVTVSISHRSGMAVCAVASSGVALGCDLEIAEPRSNGFIADYFTLSEQALIAQAMSADRWWFVALLWSAKESALKALKEGLRLDTRSVVVDPGGALMRDCQKNEAGAGSTPNCGVIGRNAWLPLQVRYGAKCIFHGWWHQVGVVVMTLVANPPPRQPSLLPKPVFTP
jgi:4'-phosphopantetheinyl transferase